MFESRNYLNEILRIQLNVDKLNEIAMIEEKYIDLFVDTIEIGALWVHLTCIFWAVSEWKNSKDKGAGFDFKQYAIDRTHCYFKHKKIIS